MSGELAKLEALAKAATVCDTALPSCGCRAAHATFREFTSPDFALRVVAAVRAAVHAAEPEAAWPETVTPESNALYAALRDLAALLGGEEK